MDSRSYLRYLTYPLIKVSVETWFPNVVTGRSSVTGVEWCPSALKGRCQGPEGMSGWWAPGLRPQEKGLAVCAQGVHSRGDSKAKTLRTW